MSKYVINRIILFWVGILSVCISCQRRDPGLKEQSMACFYQGRIFPKQSGEDIIFTESGRALFQLAVKYSAGTVASNAVRMSWGSSCATGTTGTPVLMENTGLAGWWKLDEKSGTTASDSSGYGNHGQLIGGPTWVDGRIGGALHFANTDDTKIYVDIPNSPTLENVQEGDWTVAAWVWPNHLPPGTEVTPAYGIVVKQGRHIGLVYDQDGLFKMQHHSSAGYSLAKSARKSPGAWYHVTGTVSKSNGFVKIYVNGKLEATVNFTPGATAVEFGTETWKLGIAGPDYPRFREAMNGKVDDVRIYSRILSVSEIAALAAQ